MMFNPLALLTEDVLDGLVNGGHKFFVRQQYFRGHNGSAQLKGSFVVSYYDNYFRAKEHLDILQHDAYRYLYDWEVDEHRDKLKKAASQPEGYRVFANLFTEDWEKQLTPRLKEKIRSYITHLGWKPSARENIEPQFYPHFGEVYVSLQYRGREVRVNFEEIENTI